MLAQATLNAREAADRFAKTAGAKVGKIKRATQGLFSIGSPYSEYDSSSSFQKKIRVVTQVEFFID